MIAYHVLIDNEGSHIEVMASEVKHDLSTGAVLFLRPDGRIVAEFNLEAILGWMEAPRGEN